MPEREQLGQAGVFIAATLAGLFLLVVLPRQCSNPDSAAQSPPHATAPAPDPIGPRLKKGKAGAHAENTAQEASQSASTVAHDAFVAEAVKLSQLPVDDSAEALEDLFTRWAAADAPGCAVWLQSLPTGEFREAAAAILCQHWVLSDPPAASAWVLQHLGTGSFRAAAGAVASQWCALDPTGAAQWVASIPTGADRTAAEAALAQAWAEKDPSAATEWLKKLPPESQSSAAQNLVSTWSATDPAATAQWLQSALPENPAIPNDTVAVLVSSWVDHDAGAVSRWLNSLPEGPFYETAAAAFSQAAAETSPKDAILWAKTLENPASREHTLLFAMEKWYDTDKDAFLKALPAELESTSNKSLQQAIFEMLYRKDPAFKESLLDLATSPPDSGPK